jgi:hypothetical protein
MNITRKLVFTIAIYVLTRGLIPGIKTRKDEDQNLSETDEGLVLSHAIFAVEQNEARVLPETKDELVHHIMNVDEMESEEIPMSPEIIAREQKKDTHLK